MSAAWRAHGKMVQLYIMRCGPEADISLEMALSGHYRGKLYHHEIDLVEDLPPPVSKRCMREFVGFLLVEGVNVGSSGPAPPSRTAVGVVSPVRSPIRAPSEETESDNAGLHPHKVRRNVFMVKILGGIRGILGSELYVPGYKEGVVVPSSSMPPTLSFTCSLSIDLDSVFVLVGALGLPRGPFQPGKPSPVGETGTSSHPLSSEAYAPDRVIGRDSLLSEDIAA
ncbi:unnamed protein product [Lactuca saligna]|uniref:Uncharacterized protein n=1 Tax=Lactuca saligna TaxID=75948 RepID=A0AA35ZUG5_LACSI|nr:unnamed protein product [Lactuca saligna]